MHSRRPLKSPLCNREGSAPSGRGSAHAIVFWEFGAPLAASPEPTHPRRSASAPLYRAPIVSRRACDARARQRRHSAPAIVFRDLGGRKIAACQRSNLHIRARQQAARCIPLVSHRSCNAQAPTSVGGPQGSAPCNARTYTSAHVSERSDASDVAITRLLLHRYTR
jgi:hypothetical protein